jgi:peptidoglycan/LPS O-acetylase OafA/YrhL
VSSRRRDIQGLRALAVILVVCFHGGLPVPGGFTGVDVFFAISGFVITGTLVRELESTGRIVLSNFYARRVKRLLPALALMLCAFALLGTLASPLASQRVGALTGVAASFFTANLYLYHLATGYFDPSASLNPLLHTWTLAVEEQFYVIFPSLLLAAWWLGRKSRRNALLLGATAVAAVSFASFALAVELARGRTIGGVSWPQQLAFYGSPTRAWEFGAGALLALTATQVRRIPKLVAIALGWVGIAAVMLGALTIHGTAGAPGTIALLPIGGTLALLAAGTASPLGAAQLLSIRPAQWIGDLSYSWYLWHWPLIVFGRALLPETGHVAAWAAALSLLPAWLSYRFVENPIRFRPALRGGAVVALAVACIAAPVAACAALAGVRHELTRNGEVQAWEASQHQHADVIRGCAIGSPPSAAPAGCTWPAPGARGSVILIGDSNAGQFSEPVVRAARRAHLSVTIATLSSCPFAEIVVKGLPGEAACRDFVSRSLRDLLRLRPVLVIVSNRANEYIGNPSIGLADPMGGGTAYSAGRKARLWTHGLRLVLAPLNAAGIPVVLVQPIPPLSLHDVGSCAVIRVLLGNCDDSVPTRAVAERRRRAIEADNSAASGLPGLSTLDFERRLCSANACSSTRGDTIVYRDAQHLTVAGSLLLVNDFYAAIRRHADFAA